MKLDLVDQLDLQCEKKDKLNNSSLWSDSRAYMPVFHQNLPRQISTTRHIEGIKPICTHTPYIDNEKVILQYLMDMHGSINIFNNLRNLHKYMHIFIWEKKKLNSELSVHFPYIIECYSRTIRTWKLVYTSKCSPDCEE